MKKNLPAALIMVIAFALFTAGCPEEPKDNHTNPAFLKGTWARTATKNLPKFSINSDMSFECIVEMPEKGLAKVEGNLDHKAKKLGPNDYYIRNMVTVDDTAGTYTAGNNALDAQLAAFQNLLATLTPNSSKTEFVFSATNQAAHLFFGGTYTKE